MNANQTLPQYELKNELARYSIASESRDGNPKLAWVNSVCVLFLAIGIFGARRGVISIRNVPPIREVVPVVVMPTVLPPPKVVSEKKQQPKQQSPQSQVFVALPNAPNVHFSVPTIGTIVASGALATAPLLNPLEPQQQIASVGNTGAGGERPQPPYPQLAMESGEQGTIVLLLGADDAGNVVSVDVKKSSGFPFLDQATVAFIKTHWHLPVNTGTQRFQTSITFKLQL